MFWYCALAFIALFIMMSLYWYYIFYINTKSCKINGPKPYPIIGNIFQLKTTSIDILYKLQKFTEKFGETLCFWQGFQYVIFTANVDHVEQILKSNINITKSDSYDLVRPWMGDGLLLSTGNKWKSRRKLITPSFHFKILEEFIEVFNKAGDTLVNKLREKLDDESVDVCPLVSLSTLSVICETSMGISLNEKVDSHFAYVKAVKGFLNIANQRIYSFFQRNLFLFQFSTNYRKYEKYLAILHNFTNNVIQTKRRNLAEISSNYEIENKKALLHMLLMESGKNAILSDEDIKEEIDTFMFEGHDTVSSAIAFALYEIARHPAVQQKIHYEIKTKLLIPGIKNMNRILHEMKYLEMVLKEVLRLYPSVPMIGRVADEDFYFGADKIRKGTKIGLFIYGLHRNPLLYKDPENFDPDRFATERAAKRPPYSYVPFSAGPRNCIGQRFAFLEMKIAIIKVLQHFELLPVTNSLKLGILGVLKSVDGVHIKLKLRRQ